MKNSPRRSHEVPKAYFEEVYGIFSLPIVKQALLPGHQQYLISLGAPILQDIRLEFRSNRQSTMGSQWEAKKKIFCIEFTASSKYDQVFAQIFGAIRKHYVWVYRDVSESGIPPLPQVPQQKIYSISGEVFQSNTDIIPRILAEIAVSAYQCSGRLITNDIRYLSGNTLVQDSPIPDTKTQKPYMPSWLAQDVRDTIQQIERPGSISPKRTLEHEKFHTETKDRIESIRRQSALLLSIREPANTDPSKDTQFFQGYDDVLEYVLPDEVCAYMIASEEDKRFAVRTGNIEIPEVCFHIGAYNWEKRERAVTFVLTVEETDALAMASQIKWPNHDIGAHEIEVKSEKSNVYGQDKPVTVTLKIDILLHVPEKIRSVLGVLGKILHERGYELLATPEILRSFGNRNGSLQVLASIVSAPSKKKPPVDR